MTAVVQLVIPCPGRPAPRPAVPVPVRGRPSSAQFRRRRTVAALLVAALLGAGAALIVPGGVPLAAPGPAPAAGPVPVARSTYVVQPGDTLWGIARRLQPAGDVRPLVQWLAAGRRGRALQAGERLALPAGPASLSRE